MPMPPPRSSSGRVTSRTSGMVASRSTTRWVATTKAAASEISEPMWLCNPTRSGDVSIKSRQAVLVDPTHHSSRRAILARVVDVGVIAVCGTVGPAAGAEVVLDSDVRRRAVLVGQSADVDLAEAKHTVTSLRAQRPDLWVE